MVSYPKDWEKTQLIKILSIKKGKQKKSSEISSWAKYPHINGGIEESGYTFEWNTHPDTITISEGGNSCGFVNFQTRKFWAGGHCYVVLPDNRFVDTEFLYYLLKSHQNNLMSLRVGSGLPNIQSKSLLEYEVNLTHNKMEQKAIAETLKTFDRHIENLERLIEKKKMIRDGAVEDLMTGKTRLDRFEDEWEEKTVGDILKIFHGRSQHLVESPTGKYPILGTGGIIGKSVDYLCDWECVCIGRKGTIDKPIYVDYPFWSIDTLYYSKSLNENDAKFQYYLFTTINWLGYAESSGRPSLSKDEIESIVIKTPSDIKEQQAIADILTAMDKEIADLEEEKKKYVALKAGAMDDLLTGKIRLV